MSVSKRLRYEVLNRDGFTCRYCHATDVPAGFDWDWNQWNAGGKPVWRPENWRTSICHFDSLGMDAETMAEAVRVAMESKASASQTWRYFCGVMWRHYRERQDIARALIAVEEAERDG